MDKDWLFIFSLIFLLDHNDPQALSAKYRLIFLIRPSLIYDTFLTLPSLSLLSNKWKPLVYFHADLPLSRFFFWRSLVYIVLYRFYIIQYGTENIHMAWTLPSSRPVQQNHSLSDSRQFLVNTVLKRLFASIRIPCSRKSPSLNPSILIYNYTTNWEKTLDFKPFFVKFTLVTLFIGNYEDLEHSFIRTMYENNVDSTRSAFFLEICIFIWLFSL